MERTVTISIHNERKAIQCTPYDWKMNSASLSIQTIASKMSVQHVSLDLRCPAVMWPWCAQVNRLELTLSIGSFAAALGAMVAGIFGMNLRSTLEESIMGFWGTTAAIVAGCLWVVFALFRYTRRRRIL